MSRNIQTAVSLLLFWNLLKQLSIIKNLPMWYFCQDDEIKKYVKQILEGANLEQITMKTVCKQVYSHYPDFDLAHKKDFIKATVKSVSTQSPL